MKKKILIWYLFTAILLISTIVNAQSVRGKVVDATTGNPIPNASIYLSGLSKGTTSNVQGEFVFYTNETKTPLIISSLGYQPDTIVNYNGKTLTVVLSPRARALREVTVGTIITTREKQMKVFLTQFIGSRNKDCVISNPDDINFTYNKKTQTLEATVNQPLIIHNKKLGYKITYYLSGFSYAPQPTLYDWEPYRNMQTSYKGNYVFEEDTLGLTPGEMKKIHKARDKAYYGSRMHFIRLVLEGMTWGKNWANDRKKTKFDYGFNNINFNYDQQKFNFIFNNIRANKEDLLNNIIVHNQGMYYSGRPFAMLSYNGGVFDSWVTFQSGEITLKRPTDAVALTPDSYNESNLIWSGKMAEQRVNELLPLDFEPSEAR
ncbi:carboxypeptidase-like regulatory domain-containing protein [Mucilaginibacter auburnensis]|uniref:Carboxypeptidase-like protein n=1 Tax=Mucilaginibacter auburnensis TaxID=1457233 RepID=A0A2H9VLD4_9SPHI|nr:carboxypeptidase-like regulatory domain-containing protein [Mucilaginibacter auburnensis]PJJ79149.1 carboxypeptidase-like protein [Mucilaginibacter auburnensis]